MSATDKISELKGLSYFIDLDWFQESGRSFTVVVEHCLCPACKERLASEPEAVTSTSLIMNVRDCCSKASGFISPKLPWLEKIFRLLLSNGNRSLSLAELIAQLSLYLDSPTSLSPQTIRRLLDNDQCYGFRQKP